MHIIGLFSDRAVRIVPKVHEISRPGVEELPACNERRTPWHYKARAKEGYSVWPVRGPRRPAGHVN